MIFFIQSESFGKVLSKVVSDIGYRKTQTRIKFESVNITLFPPGIYLEKVYFKKKLDPESTLIAEFGEVGFTIPLLRLEERSFGLGEFVAKDTVLELKYQETDTPITEIPQEKIDQVFASIKQSPIWLSSLNVENLKLITTHQLFDAKKIKISKLKDKLKLRFQISSLNPKKNSKYSIDDIWVDATIDRKKIKINRAKIQHDVQNLLIKGEINEYSKLLAASGNFKGEGNLHFTQLDQYLPETVFIKIQKGTGHISFSGSFENKKIAGKSDVFIKNLDSNVLTAKEIVAKVDIVEDIIQIKKLNITNDLEKIILVQRVDVFDLTNKKNLEGEIEVELENVELRNILKFLPSLKVLGANLTGVAKITMMKDGLVITPKDLFSLKNFVFEVGDDKPFRILTIKKAQLVKTVLSVEKGIFQIDSMIQSGKSNLNISGEVTEEYVEFSTKDSVINFEDFGNISNLDIKGHGPLDIKVHGPLEDVVIDLKGKTDNFEILGYKLGRSREDISILLKDSVVNINALESYFKSTPISGTGSINYKNSDITLGIDSVNANYHDLKEILRPIFSKLDFLPNDLDFGAKIDAQIYGKTNFKDLKIKSDINFKDLNAYGENLNLGSTKIILKDEVIKLKEFIAELGRGHLQGDFSFNLKNKKMDFQFDWDDLSLQRLRFIKKLNLNLDASLGGNIQGKGQLSDYLINLETQLTRTSNSDYKYEDSTAKIDFSPKNISGDISIFKDNVVAGFNYSHNKLIPSRLKLGINIGEIKSFAMAIFGEHLKTEDFKGELFGELDVSSRDLFNEVNLKGFVKKLNLNHDQFNVNYQSSTPQFLIENNIVNRWNFQIESPDLKVQSKGRGQFGHDVLISNHVQINAKVLEIFLKPVLSAEGFLNNSFIIDGSKSNYDLLAKSETENLNLTIEHVPVPLNDLSYKIEFFKNKLFIKEMKTSIENGSASIVGEIYFDDLQPDINLKYQIEKAEIPFMGKSFVNLTGQGMIIGDSLPYNLSGEIIVNKCQVLNELNDFSSKTPVMAQSRFLPQGLESPMSKFFNLNLRMKTDSPIRIANSLMDVSLKGELSIDGHLDRMRGQGRLTSLPGQSKIFFKNNEYIITQADINFDSKKEIKNPDFDIHALTNISNYKINAKAYGNLERFNFDLTSEPSLPRNSILSLIAFGYSDEIQSSLTQSQQQNLTQVGVGSFVFDRFKISDILNKQFGLQVNLGTVFEQSQTASLLTGRNQDGQGTLGRTRTATKIELKKRLDDALNLSVSSTMGGSIGQRQSMNLNYSLSKKVQVEGIYELRTNAEGEEDIIDNSIGGDMKFRWTFK